MTITEEMKKLQTEIEDFIEQRGWRKFHSPKDPALAASLEAPQLPEIFQRRVQAETRR